MEIINFRAVERSTQDIPITLDRGSSGRWTIQSQKSNNYKPIKLIRL